MNATTSLRLRLTGIILIPLLLIALVVGLWQWRDLRGQAAELFDRSLLSTALAIAADVARSGGDALSIETRDLLSDTSGGPVYYHAYAPDGVYVTGYATPPVRPPGLEHAGNPYVFYDSTYYDRPVRVLRLQNVASLDGISGTFTYTVWQELSVRDALLSELSIRTFIVMAVLIGTVALVVWFGVSFGLLPLTDLEDAISARSSDDLSPIRRPVPPEITGLVERLNLLFGQVEATMAAQNSFISNAAHQLRNPIAGVLAMAEAVRSAPDGDAARSRTADLLKSARHVKDLANKLLTLERASIAGELIDTVDLPPLLLQLAEAHRAAAKARGVSLTLDLPGEDISVRADPVMLEEAIANLLDNALKHGGPDLTRVDLRLRKAGDLALIAVADDGIGVPPEDVETVLSRFGQASPGEGSGLGLSIAGAVAESGGGSLELTPDGVEGLSVTLRLPLCDTASGEDQRPAA